MRRRLVFGLIAALYLAGVLLIPQKGTQALSAAFEKGKSDCASIDAAITLVYTTDDTGASDYRDFFKLVIFDGTKGHYMAEIAESITQDQSPFYWQTGRIPAAAYDGLYRVEVWDTDDKGNKQRVIEQVYLQCQTQNTWRDWPVPITPLPGPVIACYSRTPIYTTNGAPEGGAVIVMWSYGKSRTEAEYHLQTIPVGYGFTFDMMEIQAPCSTYLKLYFQPDSTKLLYYMPSQYWPHDMYGAAPLDFQVGPIYHTFFPLDGPLRGVTPAPTSSIPTTAPSATPTP